MKAEGGMMKGGSGCFEGGGDHLARDCPERAAKGKGGGKGKGCFNCGGDHLARDCPEEDRRKGKASGGGGYKGGGKSVECFNCGGNHFARDCPEGNSKGKGKKGGGGGICFDFRDNGSCRFGESC